MAITSAVSSGARLEQMRLAFAHGRSAGFIDEDIDVALPRGGLAAVSAYLRLLVTSGPGQRVPFGIWRGASLRSVARCEGARVSTRLQPASASTSPMLKPKRAPRR